MIDIVIMRNRLVITICLIVFCCLLSSCKQSEYESFNGFTEGTTYSIIYDNSVGINGMTMKDNVENLLNEFDFSLSTYNKESIVTRVNENIDVELDDWFIDVFTLSKEVWQITDGAFDVTVAPLVNAMGFGVNTDHDFSDSLRDSIMQFVGMSKVELQNGKIIKSDPRVSLDFNAIAKGYSVDVVSYYLESLGVKNYLVEIGGEVRTAGTKNGKLWRVGIDKPIDGNNVPGEYLQAVINMQDRSLATSGNYRKFYVEDGVKYSHTVDPKTGNSAKNTLLSATILADNCALADGLATSCMVLGKDEAIKLINSIDGVMGYLIFSDEQGNYQMWMSDELVNLVENIL
ncbi:MAG: FAD:protein FMN transferase [Bacteroidales bacterium]|nr:FAD:protein FMN transferase [Bacteroidales bacterium]